MKFGKLYCNGNINPIGIGTDVWISWSFEYNGKRNEKQAAFMISVFNTKETYSSEWITSEEMSFCLSEHFQINPGQHYRWNVSVRSDSETITSPTQYFETAISDLSLASWITCGEHDVSSPVFQREFYVEEPVRTARAYVSCLGLFVGFCNGMSLNDHLLMPPNTVYDTFCYMETIDFTDKVCVGKNRFEIQLGNGYNDSFSQFGYRYFNRKGIRCVIDLTYENGSVQRIMTDDTWFWRESCIRENGIYRGEVYDACFTACSEYPAIIDSEHAPGGTIIPNEMPPIRIRKKHFPVNMWAVDGGMVYDFGCNLQGIPEIHIDAPHGTKIAMYHSEMIHSDGTLDKETNRDAAAEDVYICCGNGTEQYRPTFTYHGFRYIMVIGAENAVHFSIYACQISADVENESTFVCSDAMINRIHTLCDHSMRCNLVSIPTDCPVRDERTPCQMDSQMTEEAMIYNYNMYAFYRKWLRDITNTPYRKGEENPDWHGDYIMLAYRIYKLLGDMRPLKLLYPRIRQDIEIWLQNSDHGIYSNGFGDWCLPNDNTWDGIGECKIAVNTSLLYAYCCIFGETAILLGYEEDYKLSQQWKELIRCSYESMVDKDGSIASGRQPEMILPLYFGVMKGEVKERVKQALYRKLIEDGHLDTGGFGTMALIGAAAEAGVIDLIPKILDQGTYPGFGYWLATGATSLWEQWAVKGVMHSHSHAMYAGIDAAFYRVFCGITTIKPGFREFHVAPNLPADMQFCSCKVQTVSGMIAIQVEKLYGGLEISLEVPINTSCILEFPEWEKYKDHNLWDGEMMIDNRCQLKLCGGIYHFRLVPKGLVQ
ncbi:MAG: family 78 glycoside hydrolase catalytic domain [Clostridia bacterium]|nr:family 78 glycoside hydrolase catalytic domain [Clostridia bacterium]